MEKKINLSDFLEILDKSVKKSIDYNYQPIDFTNVSKNNNQIIKNKHISTLISFLTLPDILSLKLVNKQINELIDDECMKTYLRGKEIKNLGNLNSIWDRFSNMKQ
jgi:hypothetical protein